MGVEDRLLDLESCRRELASCRSNLAAAETALASAETEVKHWQQREADASRQLSEEKMRSADARREWEQVEAEVSRDVEQLGHEHNQVGAAPRRNATSIPACPAFSHSPAFPSATWTVCMHAEQFTCA